MQWDLLPPLTCSAEQVAISGFLEPAYAIGGDSFDYAFDQTRFDFAVVEAIGHGTLEVACRRTLAGVGRGGQLFLDTVSLWFESFRTSAPLAVFMVPV